MLGRSRVSAVGIATGYGLNDGVVGVRVQVGSRIFSSSRLPHRFWGPLSLLSSGYLGALSPVVKQSGPEADHSPQTSAEIRKIWLYTATPHTSSWRNAQLDKHRDNFTFLLC
jgi:hypothetical protein